MSDQKLKKQSGKVKFVLWTIAIVGVIICYSRPWWTYIILGIVLFIGYACAAVPDDEPNAEKADNQDGLPEEGGTPQEKTLSGEANTSDASGKTAASKADPPQRWSIAIGNVDGLDADELNALYKYIRPIDESKFPEIEDVSQKGKFPQLPVVLFDNLTKTQCDAVYSEIKRNIPRKTELLRMESPIYPDRFTVTIGSLFCSDTIEFVKVTGHKINWGGDEDYWITTRPISERNIAVINRHCRKSYSENDLKKGKSDFWIATWSDYYSEERINHYIEEKILEAKPAGFHVGLLFKDQLMYAINGGQYGSPHKHPGTDNLVEFKKDRTVNKLGMKHMAGKAICETIAPSTKGVWKRWNYWISYSEKGFEVKKHDGESVKIWLGLCFDRHYRVRIVKNYNEQVKREEERKAAEEKRKAAEEKRKAAEEAEQKAADTAVLRRQKLLEKKKNNE